MRMMLRFVQLVMIFYLLISLSGCMTSGEPEQVIKKAEQPKTTELGLYLTSTEAYDLLNKDRQDTLFIDVRTRGEIAREGMPSLADANIPYFNFKKEQGKVKRIINPDFVATFEDRLKEKGLDKQSRILLICRQGNRSANAVNALAKLGYKEVYHVVDGTDGWKLGNLPFTNQP